MSEDFSEAILSINRIFFAVFAEYRITQQSMYKTDHPSQSELVLFLNTSLQRGRLT